MFLILLAHTPFNALSDWLPSRRSLSDSTEVFVLCSGMASAIAFGATFDRARWALGAAQHVGVFTLTCVPNCFDVLPMYLVLLAMIPFAVALGRISRGLVAAAVVAVWVMAQGASGRLRGGRHSLKPAGRARGRSGNGISTPSAGSSCSSPALP